MNTPDKLTWTSRDQAALADMINRRRAFYERNTVAVKHIVVSIRMGIGSSPTDDELVEELIAKADAIRDALEPFDSGVRAGSPSTSG